MVLVNPTSYTFRKYAKLVVTTGAVAFYIVPAGVCLINYCLPRERILINVDGITPLPDDINERVKNVTERFGCYPQLLSYEGKGFQNISNIFNKKNFTLIIPNYYLELLDETMDISRQLKENVDNEIENHPPMFSFVKYVDMLNYGEFLFLLSFQIGLSESNHNMIDIFIRLFCFMLTEFSFMVASVSLTFGRYNLMAPILVYFVFKFLIRASFMYCSKKSIEQIRSNCPELVDSGVNFFLKSKMKYYMSGIGYYNWKMEYLLKQLGYYELAAHF